MGSAALRPIERCFIGAPLQQNADEKQWRNDGPKGTGHVALERRQNVQEEGKQR